MSGSKLAEQDTRFPDLDAAKRDRIVQEFMEAIQGLSETARSHRFTLLLNSLFGEVHPQFIEDYIAGVEKYLRARKKDLVLRGRADALYGNAVIEFEPDLTEQSRLEEAQEQLRRYVACLWSEEPPEARAPYLCIATDGILFFVWTPILDRPEAPPIPPEAIRLEPVDEVDIRRLERPGNLYFWLDRYLLRRERMSPRTENIIRDFGPQSHAFHVIAGHLLTLWKRLKRQDEFVILYSTWERYLRIVYGSALADDELFVRHTYLATLAKLMVWARLTDGTSVTSETLTSVLEGRFFWKLGIDNFLEEDFFSWPAREEARRDGVEAARRLAHLLLTYNLRGLSEDVLKSLYQDLVDPRTRHDLGEFYTPDWLAARMVRCLLEREPHASVLDPACGSGTFLYQAIREKRERLGDSPQTLEHILNAVVGMDIHPLAVMIARTNYLLALGDLTQRRGGRIAIPVYLANAIRLPEPVAQGKMATTTHQLHASGPGYEVELDGETIQLPQALIEEPALYDRAIEAAREFAVEWAGRSPALEQFTNYLRAHHPTLAERPPEVLVGLFLIAEALRRRIEAHRDTIWAFILKNSYRPLFLRGRFDLVVGNPPWLSYRYVEQPDYQRFLKEQIVRTYRLLSGRGELITQMELGTLFLLRAADLYLKPGGTIAFVLPRSIFSADQHDALRRETFKPELGLFWTELWDLEGVEPLFNVPACVLFGVRGSQPQGAQRAQKEEELAGEEGIPGEVLSGKLPRRNANLAEAEEALRVERVRFFLNRRGRRSYWATAAAAGGLFSFYRDRFYQGATIVPRAFWFVEVVPSSLGFDPNRPPLRTARRAQEEAKEAYRDVVFQGNVEARFLYATLLSTDLLPFGHLDFRLVVLPIEPEGEGYRMLTAEEARRRGFFGLAEWLERAQAEWERRRGAKAEASDLLGWLDYRRKLTSQNPRAAYRVMYPDVNRLMCAAVVRPEPGAPLRVSGQEILLAGFVAESLTYCMETEWEDEAFYVCSVLNSSVVDARLGQLRRRSQKTHPHVHKKVLDVAPIPKYDPEREEHRRLAELGKACSEKVAAWLAAGGAGEARNIGLLRRAVREMLREELAEIDECARAVLGV